MKRCSKWSQDELNMLKQMLCEQQDRGRKDWQYIAKKIPGKTPRQCYDAFHLQLVSDGNQHEKLRHTWTQDEIQVLLTFKNAKTTWQNFQAKNFPYLSVCQIKNKHRQLTIKPQKIDETFKQHYFNKRDSNITMCCTPVVTGMASSWDFDLSQDMNNEIEIFIDSNLIENSFQ